RLTPVLFSLPLRKKITGVVSARSGTRHARSRYRPPCTLSTWNEPSGLVATSRARTASPTRRSTCTVAPGTAPWGATTNPEMWACPGALSIVVVVRHGTSASCTALKSGTVVLWSGVVEGGGGKSYPPFFEHAAKTVAARTASTKTARERRMPRRRGEALRRVRAPTHPPRSA